MLDEPVVIASKSAKEETPVENVSTTTVVVAAEESAQTHRPTPKKRVRVRKKATKKLSAAIICADPYIRRFI